MTSVTNSPERKRSTSKSPENKSNKRKEHPSSDSRNKDYKSKRSRRDRRSRSRERPPRKRYVDLDRPDEEYPQRYYGEEEYRDANVVGKRYYDDKKDDKVEEDKSIITPRQRKTVDLLTSKTGGAYIPPAKLRMMQAEITDKSSAAYQRIAWEALKKSIHGYINKINTSNIGIIARELLHENIVRGRGLLCKSLIQAQAASPTFTNVYAALVAVINSKFPSIGELLLKRLVLQFKRGFKQNNKIGCISGATFIAHLVNQRVAHEILALEILTLLVESPTDDSVEVAISFLKESGQKLSEVSSKGINAIFEMLRNILHEGKLEKRIQYMIEVMFQIRKDGFKDHAAIIEELDIVDEEEQFTHLITLDDVKATNAEDVLNVFKFDDKYEENEGKYKTLSKEILDSDSESSGSGSDGEEGSDEDGEEDGEDDENKDGNIIDNTETNLITLRRTIYLTIQSSLDFEECAHKLMKMELKPGQEIELCHMFLDCCAEQRTYEKFYGLLAQRFCQINKVYVPPFEQIFKDTYATTHRLDANKLRNVSKFFAHLLFTDAIGWEVLEIMKLNEVDTNSSSRIFIKILFQELAEYMGLGKLNGRLKDATMQEHFCGLFPRDNPKNTRFSINFFTSIGLGGLTDELREHLKNAPKTIDLPIKEEEEEESSSNSSSSSSSSDSSSSSSSSDSDDSDSSSSEDEKGKNKKKLKQNVKEKVISKKSKDNNKEVASKVLNEKKIGDKNEDKRRMKTERGDSKRLTREDYDRDRNVERKDFKQKQISWNEKERGYEDKRRDDRSRKEERYKKGENDERRTNNETRNERNPRKDENYDKKYRDENYDKKYRDENYDKKYRDENYDKKYRDEKDKQKHRDEKDDKRYREENRRQESRRTRQ